MAARGVGVQVAADEAELVHAALQLADAVIERCAGRLRQLADSDEIIGVQGADPVDQFIAQLGPVQAGGRVADVVPHHGGAGRKDGDVSSPLPLKFELCALQALPDLVVGDVYGTFHWNVGGVGQARDLALAVVLQGLGRGCIVSVTVDDHIVGGAIHHYRSRNKEENRNGVVLEQWVLEYWSCVNWFCHNGFGMVLNANDPEIIHACQRGDHDAFTVLFETNKDRVYSIALRYSGNQAAAMDIAQDTFLKLISRIKDFRGEASFEAWLYRIVANACLDHQRRGRKLMPIVEDLLDVFSISRRTVLHELVREEVQKNVQEVVGKLPPDQRMVVILRYTEDLSYEEIADVMHCSRGTVASRLNRAHKVLGRRLSHLRGTRGAENG